MQRRQRLDFERIMKERPTVERKQAHWNAKGVRRSPYMGQAKTPAGVLERCSVTLDPGGRAGQWIRSDHGHDTRCGGLMPAIPGPRPTSLGSISTPSTPPGLESRSPRGPIDFRLR